MKKRDVIRLAKNLLSNAGWAEVHPFSEPGANPKGSETFGREHCEWISGAIRVPRKVQSTVARSKQVENRVARYLWGEKANRVWKDEEDLRWEDPHMIGEVKNYYAENIFNAGGPWELLSSAMDQVCLALHDADYDDLYFPFSVLVPVGTRRIDHALTMIPNFYQEPGFDQEVIITLAMLKAAIVEPWFNNTLISMANEWALDRVHLN